MPVGHLQHGRRHPTATALAIAGFRALTLSARRFSLPAKRYFEIQRREPLGEADKAHARLVGATDRVAADGVGERDGRTSEAP